MEGDVGEVVNFSSIAVDDDEPQIEAFTSLAAISSFTSTGGDTEAIMQCNVIT